MSDIPLRPLLPKDILALRELFAQSIEELTQDDYDEDQRVAWASLAADAEAFARRLTASTTLVVDLDGELAGFASLKDNTRLDMLYVHPYTAGQGIGSALAEAVEKIAAARGAKTVTVDASETAVAFFEGRGYIATARNAVPVDDQWLTNTTMTKILEKPGAESGA
ncbi:MAG: GNAT family N-acetyltransferase [Hyphomicrobiaceae bacterium]|nr:GNAT family N-acetyltransferase [Hyphomicrobiaceae bacterium]